jgi:hypothetical protein
MTDESISTEQIACPLVSDKALLGEKFGLFFEGDQT